MSRFYPYGIWCSKYCMWCDDVVEGNNDCNGDCKSCQYSEENV
jgi:hypothetical protein